MIIVGSKYDGFRKSFQDWVSWQWWRHRGRVIAYRNWGPRFISWRTLKFFLILDFTLNFLLQLNLLNLIMARNKKNFWAKGDILQHFCNFMLGSFFSVVTKFGPNFEVLSKIWPSGQLLIAFIYSAKIYKSSPEVLNPNRNWKFCQQQTQEWKMLNNSE